MGVALAAEGEVGDVDAFFAEDGADAADDAGDVEVTADEQAAFEGGFDVHAVVGEQAGLFAVEDGAGDFDGAGGVIEGDGEDAGGSAAGGFALLFGDADAFFLGYGVGVDAVDVLKVREQAGEGGVADEVGFGVSEGAGVAELDGLDAARVGLGEEAAEAGGELDEGSELEVFLVSDGGGVDGVLDDAELQVFADLAG